MQQVLEKVALPVAVHHSSPRSTNGTPRPLEEADVRNGIIVNVPPNDFVSSNDDSPHKASYRNKSRQPVGCQVASFPLAVLASL